MSLLTIIKKLFGFGSKKGHPADRELTCIDCSNRFVFDYGEQQFFKSKGFSDPKRCPNCRKKVKSQMKKKRRGNRSRGRRRFGRYDSIIDGDSPYADSR